jgi:hypothetical protein
LGKTHEWRNRVCKQNRDDEERETGDVENGENEHWRKEQNEENRRIKKNDDWIKKKKKISNTDENEITK